MLKIEKLKDLILNYDTENCEDDFNCYLSRITTNSNDNKNICRVVTCSECVRLSLMNLLEEYKEPVKLTKFEYEYLKVAKKEEFNFIARDGDGRLFLYNNKPWKAENDWDYEDRTTPVFAELFKFVKWEDKEPYSIDEILANCTIVSGDEDD